VGPSGASENGAPPAAEVAAQAEVVEIEQSEGAAPPEPEAPEAGPAEDGDEPARDTVKLFVNRGERSGIEEEDLRWALREGAVLPEEAIHEIRVLHRFSFVEVAPDQAERAVEFLDGTKLKGKEIRLEIAKS
ncbi:MAG: DbpA RNA binding domain-containing protein, partial [Solirubrobacterales bacterium]